MNKLLVPILALTSSLLLTQSVASAEIKLTPPMNWQASPNNNSTSMIWYQNSTKSLFGIYKAPDNLSFPLFLVGPFVAQFLGDNGVLESSNQISFGHSNSGYRYILNLSSPSKLLNSFSGLPQVGNFLTTIPEDYDVPFKGILILTQKQDDLYAIIFLSPKENFDSILHEITPALDSIQLTNSTATVN
ncbi:MAG TPA: hypothetical protein VHH33_05605 [Nitrososphaeraceae archaeon]|nr:hypothetical protein [Nitrososphaeraceae archaeon]